VQITGGARPESAPVQGGARPGSVPAHRAGGTRPESAAVPAAGRRAAGTGAVNSDNYPSRVGDNYPSQLKR